MKDLEMMLLNYWKEDGIKEIYKYKHRIKAFQEPLENLELFTDLTCGTMFSDLDDIANYKGSAPKEYKVSLETLIQSRQNYV